jgi:hypothetical protein
MTTPEGPTTTMRDSDTAKSPIPEENMKKSMIVQGRDGVDGR